MAGLLAWSAAAVVAAAPPGLFLPPLDDGGGTAPLFDTGGEAAPLPAAAPIAVVVDAPLPLYARQRSAIEEKNDVGDGWGGFSSCRCRGGGGREGEGGDGAMALASIDEKCFCHNFFSLPDLLWKK